MTQAFSTLTHPQLVRALALARTHSHGWADQFDALGIDEAARDFALLSVEGTERIEPAWERTRREKMANASAEERDALRRVEEAWMAKGKVADADLRTISLIGAELWPEQLRAGIWSPGLDAEGDTSHETGTGRLSWLITRDGRTVLYINRPGEKLCRIGGSVVPGPGWKYEQVEAVLNQALPQAVRGTPVYRSEGLRRIRAAAERIRLEGLSAVLDGVLAEGTPGICLFLQEAGGESVSVLRAVVTPAGDVTVERQIGPGLYYRHVETLVRAVACLGVEWDPALELA